MFPSRFACPNPPACVPTAPNHSGRHVHAPSTLSRADHRAPWPNAVNTTAFVASFHRDKVSGTATSKPRPAPPPAAKSTGTGAIASKPQPATPPAKKAPGATASKPPAAAKFVALAKHAASAVPATYAAAGPLHAPAKNAGKVMLYNDMDVNEESDGDWDPEAEQRHLQVKGKQRARSPTDQEMDGTTDAPTTMQPRKKDHRKARSTGKFFDEPCE